MKKTNKFLKALTLILALMLVFTSLTACKKDPVKSSSANDSSDTSDIVSSEETLSSETDVSSEDTATQSSEPESSTEAPTVSTPAASKPTTTTFSTTSTPSTTPKPSTTPSAPSTPSVPSTPEAPAKKTPQELIIGKWKGLYDCGPELVNMGYEIDGEYKVNTTMEFTASGSFIETINPEDFKRVCKPICEQELENQRIANNMTPEEFETLVQTNYGMTLDEYIDYYLENIGSFLNIVTEYKFAADTLLVKDPESDVFVEYEYEFTNDNTLVTIEGDNRTTYTRVS